MNILLASKHNFIKFTQCFYMHFVADYTALHDISGCVEATKYSYEECAITFARKIDRKVLNSIFLVVKCRLKSFINIIYIYIMKF